MDYPVSNSKLMVTTIRLRNFLSYGPKSEGIELGAMNVIIGPNLSGKSNLIEALGILQAAPKNLEATIREGGGIRDWLWKGETKPRPTAEITVVLNNPIGRMEQLKYLLSFTMVGQRFELVDELLEEQEKRSKWEEDVYFFYRYANGHPTINVQGLSDQVPDLNAQPTNSFRRKLQRESLDPRQSVLSQRKDPDQYPELTSVGDQFSKIRLYREWNLGRFTPPRLPQKSDMANDFLFEDASNLALVFNALEHKGVKRELLKNLKDFSSNIEDFSTIIEGGTVQLFLHEKGLKEPIPATRLSDGTLRYMCLLAVLCHPTPPPLLCIEEPELSLHPDALKNVSQLIIEASKRTQLVITTHSDVLVSGFSEYPESVLVCERENGGTVLRRLIREQLAPFLEKYRLGELWRMGEIGGNPL